MANKKNYDSTFCGSLPLHLINSIQPYGVLIVVNKHDYKVLQVSENIEALTEIQPASAVNATLDQLILPAEFENIQQKFSAQISAKVPLPVTIINNKKTYPFLAIVHAKGDYLLLELEPIEKEHNATSFIDVYQEVKYSMANINMADSTIDVCNIAIAELKKLSGFDRITVYKFDEDWNGSVIAEVMEERMQPYLGLRFPASDIPKQSRELYFKNPYRLIPTINYTPVKIYPVINPVSQSFVDLTNCNLRSVAAVHLEYLKNMGVEASMSTAIIKEDKLWGLISCHHRQAKYLSFEKCSLFELMAGTISSRITSIENKEALSSISSLHAIQSKLISQVYAEDLLAGLLHHEHNILDILRSNGAVIAYEKKMEIIGATPGQSEMKDLIYWLQNKEINNTYAVDSLSSVYEDALIYKEVASGIIVLPIHSAKGEFIIGFRPEVIEEVSWSGNPNEAINFEADGKKYHPRNSFKLWQELVKNTSLAWNKDELQIAEHFRNFVIEYTLKRVY